MSKASEAKEREDLLVSIKRTIIPIAVGAVAATFVGPYIDQSQLRDLLAGLISAVYYTGLRFAETKFPGAGILLGSTRTPVYVEPRE